ncbi:MAG: hypothetical protein JWO68_3452 [Actinomycetia bacterium]|nr:hypothetical protein [Actinomycetes bacterium]
MERTVTASTLVDLPIGRAQELVLGDAAGILADDASSDLRSTMSLEIGEPRQVGAAVVLPLSCSGIGPRGQLRDLTAELVVCEDHDATRLELRGHYRGRPGAGFGDGVLTHQVARWLANELVTGVGARLLDRSNGGLSSRWPS